ncbi:MAG: UvrD-helicase domain-containing protein, partial [Clostridia bacterium]|nr:UvrD-helicase domain-containing protein [Clostridia bacterium]
MPEWNEMQKAVMDFESGKGALLVTAAAGSGKTAVVVERVLRLITRKEEPRDISRLLVITFTNAAAEEMRNRIIDSLRAAVEKDPGNRHLVRQQKLIHTAEFTTIDSFFFRIVRENFNLLGISPDARIAGEEEIGDLRDQVMEELLEEKYAEASPDFLLMSGLFTRGRRDDALREMIESAYRAFRSMPEPALRLREAVAFYENAEEEIGETVWGRILIDEAKRRFSAIEEAYRELREDFLRDDEGLENLLPLMEEETDRLRSLSGTGYDWDGFRNGLDAFVFPTFPAGKRSLPEEIKARRTSFKDLRDRLKEEIKREKRIFAVDAASCRDVLSKLAPAARELERLVTAFSERFLAKKTERRVLEFDDVSQYVYRLLWRRTGDGSPVPTETAIRLAERYDEVIVDEYQDTNSLQEEIFRAFTRDRRNLLMVGDVKQS